MSKLWGGATAQGGEGWLLPGVRVAPRVVVGEHACQVNHGDLCSLLLHDPPNLVASYSFLLSLVSLPSLTLDFRWLHFSPVCTFICVRKSQCQPLQASPTPMCHLLHFQLSFALGQPIVSS